MSESFSWGSGFQKARDELERLIGSVHQQLPNLGAYIPRLELPSSQDPLLNCWETETTYVIESELPGLTENDIHLMVKENRLTIRGERKSLSPDGSHHRCERPSGAFERQLVLPATIDPDSPDAQLTNGVLQIRFGKHQDAKPRTIPIKVTS